MRTRGARNMAMVGDGAALHLDSRARSAMICSSKRCSARI